MKTIEYFPGDSFIHKLDPRIKIILILLLTIAVFMIRNFYIISSILIIVLACWKIGGIPLAKMKTFFKFMFGLCVFLVVIQGLFWGRNVILSPLIPSAVPVIGGAGSLKLDGMLYGLLLSLRLFTLITLMPIITMTTPIHLFTLGLTKMGLSYRIAYMTTSAINLVPTLQSETVTIMEAQKMRGMKVFESGKLMEKFRAYPALVVPLVIGAMHKAMLMGVAMDARAFGAYKDRTYIEELKIRPKDWVALVVGCLAIVLLIVLNFTL